ncbi:hypothetical protein LLEC1_03761 [Akanthomyces lecanii]|uniref:Nephrocystin 3-like N-terminal domain-containing protein n=1 Tax=Cordyceps confragosa TaxID=2714763 RepID=A0A179I1E0_CORDF|nr:hypothetical protein LLEC1_03761 [Akanthomyces lecanii]
MKWLVELSDRVHHRRTRRRASKASSEAMPVALDQSLPEANEVALEAAPEAEPEAALESTSEAAPQATPQATIEHSQSVWTAAYGEALSLLDEEKRVVVNKGQDLEELFDNLNDTNTRQKNESILRRGMRKVQGPIKFVNSAVTMSAPLAGFINPTASAAFTITQSVTTLAVGVCGMEDRLNNHITDMLGQIKVIDECDALGQKFDDGEPIHEALVAVYKDLLLFYYAVVHVLTKKSVALAWISEQFNERIPPVVQDFLKHTSLLYQHIDNATTKVIKSIESLLIDAKIIRILGDSKLNLLQDFHLELKTKTANDACRWAVDNPVFRTWYGTAATETLALYGEMGCGKSTTMAYIIEHVTQLSEGHIPSPIICYHYCQDNETGKSLNVYSSLIQQLMQRKQQVKVQFNSWYDKHKSESNYSPAHDPKLLGAFFFDAIRSSERPVFIFLDGLDECDDKSCAELVTSLRNHQRLMPTLRCCVSLRYHEHIQTLLDGCSEIHMQSDPGRDAVIVAHMVKERLPFLESEARTLVTKRLSELAKGSAIWVQMAVDLLAIRKTRAIAKLRAFLRDELPDSGLSALYAKLFSLVTGQDNDNARALSDGLEILAIAARPLSITELGWAVALRDPETSVETVRELSEYVDTKRLLGLLSPFIASVQFEAENIRQVRLFHQSVRELVVQSSPQHWARSRDSQMSNAVTSERQSELNGKATQECVKYLLLKEIGDCSLFSSEQEWEQSLDWLPGAGIFDDGPSAVSSPVDGSMSGLPSDTDEPHFDPSERGFGGFFTYAACYWLHHLSRAERRNGPALSDVITLTTPGQVRSQNWWAQFVRPDCTRQPDESRARPRSLDPMTIVSLYGPVYLFEELSRRVDTAAAGGLSITAKQRENAVETILCQGDMSRLPKLMRFDTEANLAEAVHFSVAVMQHWSAKREGLTADEKSNFDLIFDHIATGFELMVEHKWGNELLCLAAARGCLPIIERLFQAASCNSGLRQEILRAPHRENGRQAGAVAHQSVGDAAWNGQGATVAFLLEQEGIEAHLRYKDLKGNNVLHKATRMCDPETFGLLLSRYPEGIAERDKGEDTPLQALIFERRQNGAELVKRLLQAGADVRCGLDATPSDWHEPIRMACRWGDVGVIETLVRVGGADPMSVFKRGDQESGRQLDLIDSFNDGDELLMRHVRETLLSL